MGSVLLKLITLLFAGVLSVSAESETSGCLVKQPNTTATCVYFGALTNNEAQPNEFLRTKIFSRNFEPPVLTVETKLGNESIFAPYYGGYAIYNNYEYFLFQSAPKVVNGTSTAFYGDLTEIEVVVGKDSNTTFYVKGPRGFEITWHSNFTFDLYTSSLCIGRLVGIDQNEYLYDCPLKNTNPSNTPSTTPLPLSTTVTPPSQTNSTIVINIETVIDVDVPPGVDVVVNIVKPVINKKP